MRRALITLLLLMAIDALAQDIIWHTPRRRVRTVASAADPYWTDTNSYVGLWEMETTNATQTLDTGLTASYHGSNFPNVATGPTWTIVGTNSEGRIEHGYTFNGSDGFFNLPTNKVIYGTNAFTVGTWFKVVNYPSTAYVLYSTRNNTTANGWTLNLEGFGGERTLILRNREGGNSIVSPLYAFTSNTWHFAVATHVSGAQKLYLDGVQIASSNVVQTYTAGATTPRIGASIYITPHYFFPGVLDHTFITEYVLTSNSVFEVYQYTHPTNNLRKRP